MLCCTDWTEIPETLKNTPTVKWIVGYVDGYGCVHHKIVLEGDLVDSHNKIWPFVSCGKWRWMPSRPKELNTYGIDLEYEDCYRIWQVIDTYKR